MYHDHLSKSRVVCSNGAVVTVVEAILDSIGKGEHPLSNIYSQIVLSPQVQSLVLPREEKATLANQVWWFD